MKVFKCGDKVEIDVEDVGWVRGIVTDDVAPDDTDVACVIEGLMERHRVPCRYIRRLPGQCAPVYIHNNGVVDIDLSWLGERR